MADVRRLRILAMAVVVISVGLAIGASNFLGSGQGSKTVTVGASGCDYTTIQAAIDAVPDGSTIEVRAGTYVETLAIRNRDGLTLRGEGPDKVTLDGNGPQQKDITPGILILSSRNITVTGFRITNSQRGLEADDSTLLFIEANTIERNFRSGVFLLRAQGEIRDNVVRGNQRLSDKPAGGSGIAVYGSRVTLIGNSLTGNADVGLLVVMDKGSRSQVTGSGNTIRDNKGGDLVGNVSPTLLAEPPVEGTLDQVTVPLEAATIQEAVNRVKAGGTITVSAGTYKEQVQIYKSLTIRGAGIDRTTLQAPGPDWLALNVATDGLAVVLEGMTVSGGYGGILIAAGPASAITLQDLRVKGDPTGRYTLLSIWEEPTVTLDRVSVLGSQYHGLDVLGQAKLTVQDSTISDSILGGVVISGSAVVTMRDTTIARNGSYGVNVSSTAVAELTDCTVGANTTVGIRVYGSAQVTLTNTRVTGTKPDSAGESGYGVYVYGEGRVTLADCTVSGSASSGIGLYDESGATVRQSTLSENKWDGIIVAGKSHASIEGNAISRNLGNGIHVVDSAQAIIAGNQITGNTYHGIQVYGQSRSDIRQNTISENGDQGIRVGATSVPNETVTAEISGNTVQKNKGYGVFADSDSGIEITGKGNTISGNTQGQLGGTTSKFPKGFGGGK
jgi:parallel beta-helix repeat protein